MFKFIFATVFIPFGIQMDNIVKIFLRYTFFTVSVRSWKDSKYSRYLSFSTTTFHKEFNLHFAVLSSIMTFNLITATDNQRYNETRVHTCTSDSTDQLKGALDDYCW